MARLTFTSAFKRVYPETCCRAMQVDYASRLSIGLSRCGPDFLAEICPSCDGTGCPTWSATPYDACPTCNASGLLQAGIEAPPSVLNQVLIAAIKQGGN